MAISLAHPQVWPPRQWSFSWFPLDLCPGRGEIQKEKCQNLGYKTPTEAGRRSWQWCSVAPDGDQWWVSAVVQPSWHLPLAAVLVISAPRPSPNCSGSPIKFYLEKDGDGAIESMLSWIASVIRNEIQWSVEKSRVQMLRGGFSFQWSEWSAEGLQRT